jgi:uncharacterized protein involved in cysteine biosynthesis
VFGIKIPHAVKPVVDFGIHVFVAIVIFCIVFGAAALISAVVHALHGYIPDWADHAAEYVEKFLFGMDLLLLVVFAVKEAIVLIRSMFAGGE